MTIYITGRRTGKTISLIQQFARTGAIIVAPTCQMVGCIDRMARDLGLQIPLPITVADWIRGLVDQCEDRNEICLVDELQIVLNQLNVETATLDENYKEIVRTFGVKKACCTECNHRDMCQYKEEYLAAQAAVGEVSINLPSGGDKSIKSIRLRGISWTEPVELKCHYLHQSTRTIR